MQKADVDVNDYNCSTYSNIIRQNVWASVCVCVVKKRRHMEWGQVKWAKCFFIKNHNNNKVGLWIECINLVKFKIIIIIKK